LVATGSFGSDVKRDEITKSFQKVVELDTDDCDEDKRSKAIGELQSKFQEESQSILDSKQWKDWLLEGGSDSAENADDDEDKEQDSKSQSSPASMSQSRLLAEEFVALRFVGLIHYESAQLKGLVALLGVGFVLAVFAVGSYPFLAARQSMWTLTAVFVLFGAAIIVSFAQMDRDAVLSRLNRTVAGKLDLSFYLRAASYGGLPLLTLLASQFPAVGRSLIAWLEPALNALH
jgi:hypothetical protein